MTTIGNLKIAIGTLLAESDGAVNSISMALVKAGLLSKKGPGQRMHATATDASNLLLGFLGGSQAIAVADNVTLLRSSAALQINAAGKPIRMPPIAALEGLARPHTLGDALDGILAQWADAGELLFSDTGKPVEIFEFSISRDAFGWRSTIEIFRGKTLWQAEYLALRPEAVGVDIEAPTDEMAALVVKNGSRKTIEVIDRVAFSIIAGLLGKK